MGFYHIKGWKGLVSQAGRSVQVNFPLPIISFYFIKQNHFHCGLSGSKVTPGRMPPNPVLKGKGYPSHPHSASHSRNCSFSMMEASELPFFPVLSSWKYLRRRAPHLTTPLRTQAWKRTHGSLPTTRLWDRSSWFRHLGN